jgi:hypothetical protein
LQHNKYKKIFIVSLVLLLVGFTNEIPHENSIKNKFHVLQKNYFLKLDLRAPIQELKSIPTFSAELSALADEQRAILVKNKNLTEDDKEVAGLILIYDAMLNSNILIGVLDGKLRLSDFKKRFSKNSAIPHLELLARANYIISELRSAAKLRPNDHRIDSWIVGANGLLENVQTGHVSKSTQRAIIKAIGARPSFNLWTAILMLHNEPPVAKQALLKASINFVEAANQGKDACTLHPEDCIGTWKAPYNFQAAVTELGDVFLQQAEYFLKNGDIEKAMTMVGFAEGTYSQLYKPKHIDKTKRWPDYEVLMMRKERLAEVQHRKIPKHSLRTLDQYQRAYECASCHGRVGTH